MDHFHFKGFEPTDAIRQKANRMYDRVTESAPSDAIVSALVEWDGERYHCSIEVGSQTWPAAVSVAHRFPAIAIDKAELALTRKLSKWQDFGIGPFS